MVVNDKRGHLNKKLDKFGFYQPIPDEVNIHTISKLKEVKKKNLRRDMKSGKLVANREYFGGKKND